MTGPQKPLLIALGVSALLSAVGSFVYVQLDRLHSVEEQIAFLKAQHSRPRPALAEQPVDLSARIVELRRAQSEELARFYDSGEMDLYRFASLVNGLLTRHHVRVQRFRTLTGSSAPLIELTATGASRSFMGFLGDVSASPQYWTIPYLHLQSQSDDGTLTCDMQIGFISHEK